MLTNGFFKLFRYSLLVLTIVLCGAERGWNSLEHAKAYFHHSDKPELFCRCHPKHDSDRPFDHKRGRVHFSSRIQYPGHRKGPVIDFK